MVVFLRSCGGVCVVVFLCWCLCGGVFVVVFVWWRLRGGVCVVVFLWWCSCVFESSEQGCSIKVVTNHSIGTCSVDLYITFLKLPAPPRAVLLV